MGYTEIGLIHAGVFIFILLIFLSDIVIRWVPSFVNNKEFDFYSTFAGRTFCKGLTSEKEDADFIGSCFCGIAFALFLIWPIVDLLIIFFGVLFGLRSFINICGNR